MRPRTLRARATIAVTAAFAIALGIASVLLLAVMRTDLWDSAREEALRQAVSRVELLEIAGRAPSGGDAARNDAVASADARATAPQYDPEAIRSPSPPATASAAPAPATAVEGESAIVYSQSGRSRAAAYTDFKEAQRTLRTMTLWLVPIAVVLVLVGGWLTWYALGRVLAPVEALRREVADITATDLHRRLPLPRGRDEIARLATAMNTTLDRLDRAVHRLRTFTGDVSHELRSPLTVLRTRLELAMARPGATDWPKTAADALEDTDELQALVDGLLLLARLDAQQPGDLRRLDLAALVRDRAPALDTAGSASRTQAPEVRIDAAGPAAVRGNAAHLARLLTNLVDNARRHARTAVQVRVTADRQRVTVEVTDDGAGIPAEARESVFERFTRLDSARSRDDGGAGLGLAIARAIAVEHGGTLTAEEPEKARSGARLVLRLPACAAVTLP
ncbi:sensor histidine kinase [Streptomyces melanogenes]|uniref:sensor histidine kinase n=1 Tax=Streptomyces melanogenes TaxID=67326 RepID=UPI0037AE00D6